MEAGTMSESEQAARAGSEEKAKGSSIGPGPVPEKLVIWAWPKTIVFWPTCLCAIVFGFISMSYRAEQRFQAVEQAVAAVSKGGAPSEDTAALRAALETIRDNVSALSPHHPRLKLLGIIFLCVFAFNLFAFSFDIEVRGLAIAVLAIFVIVLGAFLLADHIDVLGFLKRFYARVNPIATSSFYFIIGTLTLVILLVAMVSTYLHRVEVSHNEVRIRSGLMEAVRSLSTQRLTFTKDVSDLMEHWFLFFGMFSKRMGCGRLVFNHPQLDAPVVLDNVIGVEAKAEILGRILGVMAVKDGD